jgi:RNA polymerase sigma-70 factor (ECF subfamily)
VVVRDLLHKKPPANHRVDGAETHAGTVAPAENQILDREEIDQLLRSLEGTDASIVRMFYLEGLTYEEISSKTGVPINSIGPTLSRAKGQMRRSADSQATV